MAHFTLHAGNQEEDDQEYEASAGAAMVAVDLLSYARFILKLDKARTEYSAQYLLDNVCPKKEETDQDCSKLTAKHSLEFVLKEGIPKGEAWPHLGSLVKPPSSYIPARVSMKGELIEPKDFDEALKFCKQQPVGARLYVFSLELDDHLGEEGIYVGLSSDGNCYVGLRDVMIVEAEKNDGEGPVVTVELYYKKKVSYVKVALNAMFLGLGASVVGASVDESQAIKPGLLLVDYFLPRLSVN